MAPVVIIAVLLPERCSGRKRRGEIVDQLDEFVGMEAAGAVEEAVARSTPEVTGLLPTITGVLALLNGAATVSAPMQISLNRTWRVAARPRKSGLMILVKNRILSLNLLVSLLLIVAR